MRTGADFARELQKVADTLAVVKDHFAYEAKMNAALHMSETVRPTPLAVAVHAAYDDLLRLIAEQEETS